MKDYYKKALGFAERFGITEYKVKGKEMVYKEKIRGEGTYKATVNLDTMEETRKHLYQRK